MPCTICSQFMRMQNPPLLSFIDDLYGCAQFYFQDKVRKRSMTFLHSLSLKSFSEVPHGGVIRVFHNLIKRSTIPQVELKKNALSDLRVIVNALGALEDNRLKKNHHLRVALPSTDPVKFYIQDSHKSLPNFPGRCVIALSQHTKIFPTALATYCLPLFLHPSGLLDFGAPNPSRRHIACSRRQGGGRLGSLPLALEGRCCWP